MVFLSRLRDTTSLPILTRSVRFLLGHAVECAQPEDEVTGVDPDDLSRREECRQATKGDPVAWVVEGRDQYPAVANIEVQVAGG